MIPTEIDYVIPGNDDAIRAIRLITSRIAQACSQGLKVREERLQAMTDKEQEEALDTEEEYAYAAATPEDLEFPGEMAAEKQLKRPKQNTPNKIYLVAAPQIVNLNKVNC